MKTPDGYQEIEVLSAGPRATVIRARRERDGQGVVLKALSAAALTHADLASWRYTWTLTRDLDHRNVNRALELVEVDRRPVLVLEDIGGRSLAARLKDGPLDLDLALSSAQQVAEGLGWLHARGVVHKDINPSNLILSDDGRAQIIDFDLATPLPRESTAPLTASRLEGTLRYVSPEQTGRMSLSLDHRADLYSLGVTLYELLAGAPPFTADDPLELVHQHIAVLPPPLQAAAPAVPPLLGALVAKLLAKTPDERYQSADGLARDLARIRAALASGGPVDFPLAQDDRTPRLQLPSRLYGREREVAQLAAAVGRVSAGAAEIWLISGYAGVGKSSLVRSVQRPTTRVHGRYASGKFEPIDARPYGGLGEALRGLVREAVAAAAPELAATREALRVGLGALHGALLEVLPEAAALLGEAAPPSPLPPLEAQNRLSQAIVRFIQGLASRERPLVLFLDDLQWADPGALRVIRALATDPATAHALLLGAYRDHEIDAGHPLTRLLDELGGGGAVVRSLALGPLDERAVTDLVADTLVCPVDTAAPLARLLHARSGGNPFFLERLLRTLQDQGTLDFSAQTGTWVWDLRAASELRVAENVAALMARELDALDPQALAALQAAACLGSRLELARLAVATGRPPADLARALLPAVQAELLAPVGSAWRYAAELQVGDVIADDEIAYNFVHDRVREAAYATLPADARGDLHGQIGRRLLAALPAEGRRAGLLDAIEQLNLGRAAAKRPAERRELAALNLEAFGLARAAGANSAALAYAQVGAGLMEGLSGEPHDGLHLDLELGLAEAARINGEAALAEAALARAAALVREPAQQVALLGARLAFLEQQTRFQEAIDVALEALARFGEAAPRTPEELMAATGAAMMAAQEALAGKDAAALVALPPLTDPDALVRAQFLGGALASASSVPQYFPYFVARIATLSATRGNSPVSAVGYAAFGVLAVAGGQLAAGEMYGQAALALAASRDEAMSLPAVEQVYSALLGAWTWPYREVIQHAARAIDLGLESGSYTVVAWSAMNLPDLMLVQGGELPAVLEVVERNLAVVRATSRLPSVQSYLLGLRGVLGRQIGGAGFPSPDEEEALLHALDHYLAAQLSLRVARIRAALLLGEVEAALAEAEIARPLEPMVVGFYFLCDLVLLHGLALTGTWAEASEDERARRRDRIAADLVTLAGWAESCPANFRARHLLLAAELHRVEGRLREAAAGYDEAIAAARAGELLVTELLAAERCGRLYLALGRETLALGYLREARFLAARLGADEKVARLEQEFPQLVAHEASGASTSRSTTHAVSLDVHATIQAIQAIAAEIDLDRLLQKTVHLLLADAGAERGALILGEEHDALVQAEGRAGEPRVGTLLGDPLASREDLPLDLIRYVMRSQEAVLLRDASREGPYQDSPWVVKAGVRALFCAPLQHQGKALGVVYLENTLAPGVFTDRRAALIRLLAAQVATSVENAVLYERLRRHSAELQQKNEQLRALDRMRDDFLARTSHELRTPLHGIIGLAQSLQRGAGRSEADRGALDMIVHSGRRLSNLLGDLLDLSTLQRRGLSLRQGPVALGALIQGVLALCQPLLGRKPIALEAELPDDLPTAYADPDRVEQVLFNLVANAIKFTERGRVFVRAALAGEMLRVTVVDTGKGIAPEAINHIFKPFQQEDAETAKRYGGTGLGLSVAAEIVALHGGALSASSVPGEGSAFSFTLPLARGAQTLLQREARLDERTPVPTDLDLPEAPPEGSGFTVLVVDDEPVNLAVLARQLGQGGYRVETVSGGQEALARLSAGLQPDIVLLDVMMPDIDGMEVCLRIRDHAPASHLPIIMLTARAQTDEDIVRGLEVGANDYLTKPFSNAELMARLRTHLHLARIHRAINLFVPYPFMHLLGRESIVELRLGDSVEQEMSVLFSDLRSFTALVEKMSPAECFAFINEYLAAVLPEVSSHGGFLDKMLGDGVMALYPGSADEAVRSALAMHAAVAALSARRVARGGSALAIGVAIHSGRLMVGTVGDQGQMSATVVSDAVNLTARLSGLNKRYSAGVLISEDTRARLLHPERLAMRALDRVVVEGRSTAVQVYEVFDADPPATRAAKEATRPSFEAGVSLFHDRSFSEAQRLFRLCLAMDPTDTVSLLYLERCGAILRQLAGGPSLF